MSLPSIQLDAFLEVARRKSFSEAARQLHVTQSALSQRVANLEDSLGSTLFIRDPAGVRLTDLGNRLLQYCQSREALENGFLEGMKADHTQLAGIVRVTGFSTVTRSILLPVLADLIARNPLIQLDLSSRELGDIPALLERGQTDFICLTRPLEKQGIESHLLGYEENVLIEPKAGKTREGIFLDHDSDDTTTAEFFKLQSRPPKKWQQSYLDEIDSIIEGVRLGLGRAVVPAHLAEKAKGVGIVAGYKPLKVPVYFIYYHQPFYTRLQQAVIKEIREKAPAYLAKA